MMPPGFEPAAAIPLFLVSKSLKDFAAQIMATVHFVPSTLLEFARGPAMQAAILIMIAGIIWRFSAILLLRRRPHMATPRHAFVRRAGSGIKMIFRRFIPRKTFWPRIAISVTLSSVFHTGFLIIILGGAPHIAVIGEITRLSWPGLPKGIIVVMSGLTLASMIALLIRRMIHPVMRLISTADDYVSWLFVFLPVLTGILLSGETIAGYGTLLALHILSVEMMMIWLPFGKLMHAGLVIASRAAMGVNFARKGAAA